MPNVWVTDLNVSQGDIDPTTGRAVRVAGDPDTLLATTYGRGSFAIRLSPIIVPASFQLNPLDDSGDSNSDYYSNNVTPRFTGLSEQTAYGSTIRITLVDVTDPNNPKYLGGYDGAFGGSFGDATDTAANQTDFAGRFNVQVNAGMFTTDGKSDGVHVIGVYATDDAGGQGAIARLNYTLDTQAIPPSVPTLALATDSGVQGDNVTNVTRPTFVGTGDPGAHVQLYINGVASVLDKIDADAQGNWSITLANALADGTYLISASQADLAGNISVPSAALSVRIDTIALAPAAPVLALASDSGVPGDNRTKVTTPTFTGTVEPLSQVRIYVNGVLAASGAADNAGNYAIALTTPLTDGTYSITAQQTDVAANVSPMSAPLTVTIDTTALAPAAPDLDPSTDSGVSQTDNITNSVNWLLDGVLEPLSTVQIFINAALAGSGTADAAGNYSISITAPLADGKYSVTAQQTDASGNISPMSAALLVTADYTRPFVTGVNPSMVAQNSTPVVVAHFTDANPMGQASIDWGDGSAPSAGSIVANPGGGYDVVGSHIYKHSGTQVVSTTVFDAAGNSNTISSTATIAEAPLVFTPVNFNATEYLLFRGQVVATAIGPDALDRATADIDWGNQGTSVATLTYDANTGIYSILGDHMYTRQGSYTVTVTLHIPGRADTTVTGQATVVNAPLTMPTITVSPLEGTPYNDIIAKFNDGNPTGYPSEFTATVNWGDGTVTAGTIVAEPGNSSVFDVLGTHTYIDGPASYTASIGVVNVGGSTVQGTTIVNVQNVAPTVSLSGPSAALVNRAITLSVGASDPSGPDQSAGFAYSIDWGDGTSDAIAVAPNNIGPYSLTHTYSAVGNYPVVVTATDKDQGVGTAELDIAINLPPVLKNVVINGGIKQRSHIDTIAFALSPANIPSLALSNLKLLRDYSTAVSLKGATLAFDPSTGQALLDLHGVTLADGDYQLQITPMVGVTLPLNFFKLAGDVNGDRIVSVADQAIVQASLGKKPGQPGYNANADLDGKPGVSATDLAIVTKDLGHALPARKTLNVVTGQPVNPSNYTSMTIDFGTVRLGASVRPVDLVIRNAGPTTMRLTDLSIPGAIRGQFLGGVWGMTQFRDAVLAPGETAVLRLYLFATSAVKIKTPVVFYTYTYGLYNYRKVVVWVTAVVKPTLA